MGCSTEVGSAAPKKRGKPSGVYLFLCRLIRVGDFGLSKDNQKGSRKRKRFREEEKAARKGYAFLKKHSEKSGFRRKDEVTGDAFCRKFVKRKGVGQNAIPSQNETKLILLLSVVIVLLLTIPVSSSKLDRVEPGEIGSSRSFFA